MNATSTSAGVKAQIDRALGRSADITVALEGDELVLEGSVQSTAHREEAERVALRVAEPAKVINRLAIVTTESSEADDPVYEASLESFPASDPPAWISR